MNSLTLNSIGDRITYCRSAMNLTRKEMASTWGGASIPTLARWELDTVSIPKKKLISLILFFNERGLLVTESWIMTGEGIPPVLLREDSFDELDFDSLAQESLLNINQKQNNFCFGQVKNNILSPIVKYGDYIGGIRSSLDKLQCLNDEVVFVSKGADILVGICKVDEAEIVLVGLRGLSETCSLKLIDGIGKMQWLIRRP